MAVIKLVEVAPRTIDELVRSRAKVEPERLVVSYPTSGTNYHDYSLRQLDVFAFRAAQEYKNDFPSRKSSSEKAAVVGLLGNSDFNYVISMLALTKLGHTVLLLSPRISQSAYSHLLTTTGSKYLLYQPSFRQKATDMQKSFPELVIRESMSLSSYGGAIKDSMDTFVTPHFDMDKENFQVTWIHHSSGSTGLPKPIYITHKAALGNYSRDLDRFGVRSFLTLPLYHTHGISSLYRSIISGRLIRMYNASLPLTKHNLMSSFRSYEAEIFATVPYALKILHESDDGIEFLKQFKLVTFGGAPCPDSLGDSLTAAGVKLVTIFGMGETGPLMTSWRPDGDNGWNYLRPTPLVAKYLRFEDRGDEQYELVVDKNWPSRVATNRPDGSYATSDLFIKHPTLEGWKYSGRIDDVIVLEKGEKANPLPVEGAVRKDELVTEAVVFGVGKPHFGIFIILSELAAGFTEEQIIDKLLPIIDSPEALLPDFAKISRNMVVLLPAGTPYPMTDKRTVIRKAFYRDFSKQIDEAYLDKVSTTTTLFTKNELREFLRSETHCILGLDENAPLTDDDDFFELGMDSLQASQLRSILLKNIALGGQKLGLNIVFDHPSVESLTNEVYMTSLGSQTTENSSEEEIKSLIEKYTKFDQHVPRPRRVEGQFVVITGATGSLGAHLLAQLAHNTTVKGIYCLVRAASEKGAESRVIHSLTERKLYNTLSDFERGKIISLPSNFALPSLGLNSDTYNEISSRFTTLYHCAWNVNFNLRLSSFEKDCIAGIKNLIDLCLKSNGNKPARIAFSSSIGTVLRTEDVSVPEALPIGFSSTQPTGYGQSKLVAEHICSSAITKTGIDVYVIRVGQIIGDTKYGIWNSSEAVPLMLQTSQTIGALPSIDESLRWLPVDLVAQTMIEVTNSGEKGGFFNLVNPKTFHWTRDLLPYLKRSGMKFDTLDPPTWLNLLRASNNDPLENPPIKLLEYLSSNYDTTGPRRLFKYETANTHRVSPTFQNICAPGEQQIGLMVHYFTSVCWKNVKVSNP
ncbi:hypothetical protein B7463_g2153, partial [Scytalidium lignicola]